MTAGFDPYYEWLGIPPAQQPPNFYRLLGLELYESSASVIDGAADRQMAHLRTFQNGPRGEQLARLLSELAAARAALLDPEKKRDYDERLRKKLAAGGALKVAKAIPLPAAPAAGAAPGLRSASPIEAPAAQTGRNEASRPQKLTSPARARFSMPLVGGALAAAAVLAVAGFAFFSGRKTTPKPVAKIDKAASVEAVPAEKPLSAKPPIAAPVKSATPISAPASSAPVTAPQATGAAAEVTPTAAPAVAEGKPTGAVADKSPPGGASGAETKAAGGDPVKPTPVDAARPARRQNYPPDLLFYASFDESGNDPPVNLVTGAAAKVNGSPKRVPGKRGQAFEFDGKSWLDFGDCCPFNYSDAFSYGCWVKEQQTGRDATFLGRIESGGADGGSDARGYDLSLIGRDSVTANLSHSARGGHWFRIDAKGVVLQDAWHHLLVVHKAGNAAATTTIFLDGLKHSAAVHHEGLKEGQSILGNFHFTVGSRDKGDYAIRGLIDEVQVYRRALSEAEAAVLASGREPFIGAGNGTIAKGEGPAGSAGTPAEAGADSLAVNLSGLAPVPKAAELKKAQEQIKFVFKKELAEARTSELKQALCDKLIKLGMEEQAGSDTQYAALLQAREMAQSTGNAALAWDAIETLARSFQVDAVALRRDTLLGAIAAGVPTGARKTSVEAGLRLADDLLAREDFASAAKVLTELSDLARPLRDKDLVQAIADRRKRGAELYAMFKAIQPALEKLKTTPDDAESHLSIGRFLCAGRSDWDSGLIHLAKGGDANWAQAAKSDLANPTAAKDQVALADRWFDLASANPKEKTALQQRAAMWYALAKEQASGLDKAKAEKRLAELPAPVGMRPPGSAPAGASDLSSLAKLRSDGFQAEAGGTTKNREAQPGQSSDAVYLDDLAETDASVGYGRLGKHGESGCPGNAGEPMYITFRGAPVYHALATHPQRNDDAAVAYDLDERYERFAAAAALWNAKDDPQGQLTFSVVGDGRVLWKSEPLSKKETTASCSISVHGVKRLQLFIAHAGPAEYAGAAWLRPMLSTKAGAIGNEIASSSPKPGAKPDAAPSRTGRPVPGTKNAAPPPAEDVVAYLDDMDEARSSVGLNTLLKHGKTHLETVTFLVKGKAMSHALLMTPSSDGSAFAEYRLAGKAVHLRATAATHDNGASNHPLKGTVAFRVIADGRTVWASSPIKATGEFEECEVNLEGVRLLRLEVECEGPNDACWTGWANPRLVVPGASKR